MSEKVSLVVGPAEVRFPNLEETEHFQGTDTGKFSCTFMFDAKSDSVKEMKKAISQANGGKGTNPLSQVPEDAEYDAGMWKIKGKSKFPIKVVDIENKATASSAVQGATVQAVLGFAPYSMGQGGVTCYLNAIRVLSNGSGGGGSVDFGPVPSGYEPGSDIDESLPF